VRLKGSHVAWAVMGAVKLGGLLEQPRAFQACVESGVSDSKVPFEQRGCDGGAFVDGPAQATGACG
jgi:hypothetical protein